MIKRAKKDVNQDEIVETLRGLGYSVCITHMLGDGFPDIVVGKHDQNWLFEIKNPEYKWKLTPKEEMFFSSWLGQVDTIESAEDALKIIGV